MKRDDGESRGFGMGGTGRVAAGLAVALAVLLVAGLGGVAAADGGGSDTEIHPATYNESGETTLILQLPDHGGGASTNEDDVDAGTLRTHAEQTQSPVVSTVTSLEGVSVQQRFWITNAVAVRVDSVDDVTLERLAAIDGVETIHPNFQVDKPDPIEIAGNDSDRAEERISSQRSEPMSSQQNVTYGLAQIGVPEARNEFGVSGEGVRVTVLDTGVDPDHPDINVSEFAAFNDDGSQISDPEIRDVDGHGTHVSGTVTGGNASGTQIGVAPDAELYHGRVLDDDGGSFAQIIGGIQWAVQQDTDVLVMSLGASGYEDAMVDAVQNARAEDVVVVVAAGNAGEGTSSSPGNYPESFSVGATTSFENVAFFSGGEVIDTQETWGENASDSWPEQYIVPDVAAPGFGVYSSLPNGEYGLLDGTSMAAPHVAGVAALAQEANSNATNQEIEDAIVRTTRKPDGDSDKQDPRYGYGIVDTPSTVELMTTDTGITGVVEEDGTGVEGVQVELVGRYSVTTNATGAFELIAKPGDVALAVDEFGYEPVERTVTVPEEGTNDGVTLDLNPVVDVDVRSQAPESAIAGKDEISPEFEVVNADTLTVTTGGDYNGTPQLLVNGQEATFGEPVDINDGPVNVSVTTQSGTSGTLNVTYQVDGLGGSKTVESSTFVEDDPVEIAVVGGGNETIIDDAAIIASALETQFPRGYFADPIDINQSVDTLDSYDGAVINHLPNDERAEQILETTESAAFPAVYLELTGEIANATTRVSEVTGDPVRAEYNYSLEKEHGLQPGDRNHPIFKDIPDQPDGFSIHTNEGDDYATVEDASGETIAELAVGNEIKGDAMVVDADNGTVIAAGFGRDAERFLYPSPDEYTETGNRILANAVEYLYESNLGTVRGTVTSSQGTPVPGATVSAVDENGDVIRATTTNDTGEYTLVANETTVDIEATAVRSTTDVEENVTIVAGGTQSVNFTIEPEQGTLAGTVTDGEGSPIEGATAEVVDGGIVVASTQTNADGEFAFDLPTGTYDLQVSADGVGTGRYTDLEVSTDETTVQNVTVGTVAGEITDAEDGTVIENATIELLDSSGVVASTITTENGEYIIETFEGDYTLRISATGYKTVERAVTLTASGSIENAELEAGPSASIVDGPPASVEAGQNIELSFETRNVDNLTVTWGGEYSGSPDLAVDAFARNFGEPVTVGQSVDVLVETQAEDAGTIEVTYTFQGDGETITETTTTTVDATPTDPGYYAGEDDVVQTGELRTAVQDWQQGEIDSQLLQEVLQAWQSGKAVGT